MLPRRFYITLHGLGPAPSWSCVSERQFWLPVEVFERTLVLAPELERAEGIEIVFTFDDGNETDIAVAAPLLEAYDRRAQFFVCAGRVGAPGYLDRQQLRDLVARGMEIGSHGYDHLDWRTATDDALARETSDSKRVIEAAIGRPIAFAAAPFGAIDQRVLRRTLEAGYRGLYASSGGFATSSEGLVPRTSLKVGFDPERDLPAMVSRSRRAWSGAYDLLRRVKYRYA